MCMMMDSTYVVHNVRTATKCAKCENEMYGLKKDYILAYKIMFPQTLSCTR